MSVLEWVNERDAEFQVGTVTWSPKVYRCHLAISQDDDGTFSAIVLNLPGAGSCGRSESEAIANAKEAVTGVIASYDLDTEPIPWLDPTEYEIPEGAKQKWVLVDA